MSSAILRQRAKIFFEANLPNEALRDAKASVLNDNRNPEGKISVLILDLVWYLIFYALVSPQVIS